MSQHAAHSRVDVGERHWHHLEDHLEETARLAESYAAAFDAGDWGRDLPLISVPT